MIGVKILLESLPFEIGDNITVQERIVYSGMSDHSFDVGLGIEYNVTVWAITHEGYGKGTRESFISFGDSKLMFLLSLKRNKIHLHNMLLFFSQNTTS